MEAKNVFLQPHSHNHSDIYQYIGTARALKKQISTLTTLNSKLKKKKIHQKVFRVNTLCSLNVGAIPF